MASIEEFEQISDSMRELTRRLQEEPQKVYYDSDKVKQAIQQSSEEARQAER